MLEKIGKQPPLKLKSLSCIHTIVLAGSARLPDGRVQLVCRTAGSDGWVQLVCRTGPARMAGSDGWSFV